MSRIALLLVLLASVGMPTAAQPTLPPSPSPTPSDEAARFRLADNLLAGGQTERAIALLEDLYADAPGSFAVYAKLRAAYDQAKAYDQARALIEQRMRVDGRTAPLLADLGVVAFQLNDLAAAQAAWAAALDADPDSPNTYRLVYATQSRLRLYDDAVATIRTARDRLDNPSLFRHELAQVYGLTAQFGACAEEYVALLRDQPEQVGTVRHIFNRYSDDPQALPAFDVVIDRAIQQHPVNRAFRDLSAWIALERGDYQKALNANRAIDRLEREQGQALFAFAQAAADAGAFPFAQQAYTFLLRDHPQGALAPDAQFGLARLHAQQAEDARERALSPEGLPQPAPNYDAARAALATFASSYPGHPLQAEAQHLLAVLLRDVYFDYEEAEALFAALGQTTRDPDMLAESQLALGELALLRGDLLRARIAYAEGEETLRIGEAAELARLQSALLDFYEGAFEGALVRVRAMNENTATNVANDAISLKLLLLENRGPDSTDAALRSYAQAALLHRQRHPAAALDTLDALARRFADHALADEAAFLRGQSLRDLGRIDEALAVLERLPSDHPESYLADRSLFLKAEILEKDRRDAGAAVAAYTDLLTRFPGSLFAPEARQRLRHLRVGA